MNSTPRIAANVIRCVNVALGALLIAGCASHPMGLSDEQWKALPPSQQAEYRAKQYQMDEQRRQEMAREAAEQARAERERIAALRASARFGDAVRVTIQGGQMVFFGKQAAYEPVSLELVRGETREVEFVQQGLTVVRSSATASLSEDGNTFTLEDTQLHRTVLVNDGWEGGRSYPAFLGARIWIQYRDDLPGAPQKIIIHRR